MIEQKSRTVPLPAAMVRLAYVAELIKERTLTDEVLRDLCDDYRLARQTLTKLKKVKPRKTAEIAEYKTLIAELEDEIVGRLLGTDGQQLK